MTEEWLDILTPQGKLTGTSKPKSAVHRDGDWHAAVHIWVLHPGGYLLIQRRSPAKINHPNLWDISVAGHVSAGETMLVSAQRELAEEIGLSVSAEDLQFLCAHSTEKILNQGTYLDREWQHTYLLTQKISLDKLKLQAEEVAAVRWISLADFQWVVKYHDRRFVPHWEGYQALLETLKG